MDKNNEHNIMVGCDRGLCHQAVGRQDRQLNTYDWLADVPGNVDTTDLVEVQFKHTRKGYYHNVNNLELNKGDVVAVEASPGHDIGVVTLTGRLVKLQLKKANIKSPDDIKRVYRIARETDMQKFREAARVYFAHVGKALSPFRAVRADERILVDEIDVVADDDEVAWP